MSQAWVGNQCMIRVIYFNQSLLQKKGLLNRSLYGLHETKKNGAEYASISHVYEPLNKLLDMLLPHLNE